VRVSAEGGPTGALSPRERGGVRADDPLSPRERAGVRTDKVEQGLEQSRTLVLCMSANAFASDWVKLERHTALFRDPTNAQRRFVPLRLDDTEIKDRLKQFAYVDCRKRDDGAYRLGLRRPAKPVLGRVCREHPCPWVGAPASAGGAASLHVARRRERRRRHEAPATSPLSIAG